MPKSLKFPLNIIGAQWGDEGKGKIVDLLSKEASSVVRYNGGNNAGHTVIVGKEKFQLSLLPSGVVHQKKLFLAQGVVIDPKVLLDEIAFFEKRGFMVSLGIDPRVNIVMPYHKELDAATEQWKGKRATGSLHLGIGYCYEDKNNRSGVRFEDIIEPKVFKDRLNIIFGLQQRRIEKVFDYKSRMREDVVYKEYVNYGRKLKRYLYDVSTVLNDNKNKKVLFEGAHGTFLDGAFGTVPFTTAVYVISGAIFPYVGLSPQKVYTMGIVKAYTTRVGNGPFPTELDNSVGEEIRKIGKEFGTVSKRPRRCGWLDLPLLKTAVRLSGFDYLAITKLDVLSTLSKIQICVGYKLDGKIIKEVPLKMNDLKRCKPVYKEFVGWQRDLSNIRFKRDLPIQVKKYLDFVEKELAVPIKIVSVGPDRNANIIL